jgi:hypothetical protein
MASTFAGLSLFDSGPHRFAMERFGRHYLEPDRGINTAPTTWDREQAEVTIVQRGRLVAGDDAALMALVDAVRAQAELPRTGTLVDHHGRSWASMTMLSFAPGERVDRGRTVSVAYTVLYRHIL